MKGFTVLAAVSVAAAQTFDGFPLRINTTLPVTYGNITVRNGQQLPRSQVLSAPNISVPSTGFSVTGRAVLVMMDSDVPSNGSRTTLLHWLAPDIVGTTTGANASFLTLPPASVGVPYQPPTPPQGDYPHRYSFLLWEQPRGFSIPSNVTADNRRGFNLQAFIAQSGLNGSQALAANYILVANTSGPATTSFPPAAFTATSTLAALPTGNASTTSTTRTGTATGATTTSTGGAVALQSESALGLLAALFGLLML